MATQASPVEASAASESDRAAARSLLPARFTPAAVVAAVFFVSSTLTRLVLLFLMRESAARDGAAAVARALGVGLVYDVAVACWLAAPLVLYLALSSERHARRRFHRGLVRTWVGVSVALAAFTAASELVFFDEFNGRFNFVAVDYLIYPTEVVTNIEESFPVVPILLGVALLVAAVMWLVRGPLRRGLDGVTPASRRARVAAAFGVALVALTIVVSPGLARVSDDRALNEVASNGYYTFFQALLGQDAPYDGLYATRPDSVVVPRLRQLLGADAGDASAAGAATTARRVRVAGAAAGASARPRNVVVVLEESLGSEFIGTLRPGQGSITPRFDSLAAEGTLLTNAYSTGNRTIRALEATTSSLPPLPGVSIVRRPQSRGLFTLPAVLGARGYHTEFIYGGRALFDGMGSYMRANGMQRVVDQAEMPAGAFTTAWGVADEWIFDKALARMDTLHAAGTPFYTLVLTVTNHRPYTYPTGRIKADPAKKRRRNAVRYADYALGRFMRQARTHAFFDNTIFVLMGDHGARVYGAAQIPLGSYQVPIVLYAPGLVPAGRRVPTLASSMDIPPTVLGLLGADYDSKFFGQDVLAADTAAGRAPMTHNADLALLRGDRIAVLGLKGATSLFRVLRPGTDSSTLERIAEPDSAGQALVEDAIAFFQGADHVYRRGGYAFGEGQKSAVIGSSSHRSYRVTAK